MVVFRLVISFFLIQEVGGDLIWVVWIFVDDVFRFKLKMCMYILECYINEFYEDDEKLYMVWDYDWVKLVVIVGVDDGWLLMERDEEILYMIFGVLMKGWDDVLVKVYVVVIGGNVQVLELEFVVCDL